MIKMNNISKKIEKVYYKLNYDIEIAEDQFNKDPEKKVFENLVEKRNNLSDFCKEVIKALIEERDENIEILEDYDKFIAFIAQKQDSELQAYEENLKKFRKKMKKNRKPS